MIQVNFRNFEYGKDLDRLYKYMMKEDNQVLFSHGFQMNSLQLFERWISEKFARNEYHDFFMIEDGRGNTIGFTFSYEFYSYDAHCKFTLCLFEEYVNQGYGAVAAVKMMDYLFCKYPLRRVYVSVFDYNRSSIDNNLKGGFEEIAVLPEYRFWGGEYYSLHIMAMTRDKFYSEHKRMISIIRK